MTAIIVIAAIICILALLCLIPITVELSTLSEAFSFRLLVAHIKVLPKEKKSKPKAKKAAKSKNGKQSSIIDTLKRLGLSFDEWLSVIKAVLKMIGKIGSSVKVPDLMLHITLSDPDPFKTVMNYNYANAALNALMPSAEKVLKIKNRNINLSTDFESEKSRFELDTKLYVRVGSLLLAALTAAVRIIVILLKHRSERKAKHGEQTQRADAVNDEQH